MKHFNEILKSVAIVPSVLALCFLLFAIILLTVQIDYDAIPILKRASFNKKEDVQFIFMFIIGGIFTLTIFSYTMVMNVLNRNINTYSPRLIPLILSQKHHQLILGFTSGTIIYSMTLAIAINAPRITYFPTIGATIAVLFGIACVILFIYFIHSTSQSIHINYIIKEAYLESKTNSSRLHENEHLKLVNDELTEYESVEAGNCGYLKMPNLEKVGKFIEKHECSVKLLKIPGQFVLEKEVFLQVSPQIPEQQRKDLLRLFPIDHNVPMDVCETGAKHLVEVAVKSMSRAINDPGTSITAIDYLSQLLIHRAQLPNFNAYSKKEPHYFYFHIVPFNELCQYAFIELYRYVKDDPIVLIYLKRVISTLNAHVPDLSLSIEELKFQCEIE